MELDDQFSLDSKEEAQRSKVTQSKSMKSVYEELAKKAIKQENTVKPPKKEKRAKLQNGLKKEKNDNQPTKTIAKMAKIARGDSSCRYIKNRTLQAQLKQKALSGVLKIMNMISKTQAERKVQ